MGKLVTNLGLITKHFLTRPIEVRSTNGIKIIKLKLNNYKLYATHTEKDDNIETPQQVEEACHKGDYTDHGTFPIKASIEVAKLVSLSDVDRAGRIYEYIDAFAAVSKFNQLTKSQHWHNYELMSREINEFKSLMPKKFQEGLYGKVRLDQAAVEYNHYLYWFYGEKDYTKLLVKEIKSTWVGDFLNSFRSFKHDASFNLSGKNLLNYANKVLQLGLDKSVSIHKTISLWVSGIKALKDMEAFNRSKAYLEIINKIENEAKKLSEEDPSKFDEIEELEIFVHEPTTTVAEFQEANVFLEDPTRDMFSILNEKTLDWQEGQSS